MSYTKMKNRVAVLDTETTGLGLDDQIIEMAIVDLHGVVLFDQSLRPTVPIDPEAEAVHGITMESLMTAPQWPGIANQLETVLRDKSVVIYNSPFDLAMLRQTAAAFDDPAPWIDELDVTCAMMIAADIYGPTNKYGTISLTNAVAAAGLQFVGKAHSALGDAQTTAILFDVMNRQERTV